MRDLSEADLGGTFQARFERNAFDEALFKRLADLDLGDASLVFGRIDRVGGVARRGGELPHRPTRRGRRRRANRSSSTGGRRSPSRSTAPPVATRWVCVVAATSSVEGRRLLGIEDELFGDGHLGVGHDEGLDGGGGTTQDGTGLRGYSTLLAALERGRTGTLGDIVATIQGEQDEIIRSPQHGVLVVQGGPGTGKTVVALHRAAYLLYTHRFPLEDQGVLVIGPNRVFLRYIERVLPSLGEAGVEQVVLADLVPGVSSSVPTTAPALTPVRGPPQGRRPHVATSSIRRSTTVSVRCAATWCCRSALVTSGCASRSPSASSVRPGVASVATTAAVVASRTRSGRPCAASCRDPEVGPGAVKRRAAGDPRDPRSARSDVAAADAGPAAARSVRLEGVAEVGGARCARRERGTGAVPSPFGVDVARRALDPGRRRAPRRRP